MYIVENYSANLYSSSESYFNVTSTFDELNYSIPLFFSMVTNNGGIDLNMLS